MQNGVTVACRGINVGIRSRPLVRADVGGYDAKLHPELAACIPGSNTLAEPMSARRVAQIHQQLLYFLPFLAFYRHAILAGVHPNASAGFQPLFKQSSGKQRQRVTEGCRSGGREERRGGR